MGSVVEGSPGTQDGGGRRTDSHPTTPPPLPVLYWFPAPYSRGPGRQAQLTAELSRRRRVLYLAEVGAPTGTRSGITVSDGLGEVTVLTLRVGRHLSRLDRRAPLLAGLMRGALVRRCLRDLRVGRHILVLGVPARWLIVPAGSAPVALDYQDPTFEDHPAHARTLERVCRRACLVTATAASLEEDASGFGARVARLPNAVEARLVEDGAAAPREQTRPRVGYLGTVDSRFDVGLLAGLAASAPDLDFVLAGRVNAERRDELDAAAGGHRNIEVLGPLSATEGEAFLDQLDVGLVPFAENRVGDAINATKYYHYAAHGLPIVSSDTREARGLSAARSGRLRLRCDPERDQERPRAARTSRRPSVTSRRRTHGRSEPSVGTSCSARTVTTDATRDTGG